VPTRKPTPRIDLTGRRFGLLTVQEIVGRTPHGKPVWQAVCDCGATTLVLPTYVLSGDATSCGCVASAMTAERNKRRAKPTSASRHREYASWSAALRRCTNPKDKDYPRYGGAGVTFAAAWIESFDAFYDHIGPRPANRTLDRIDGTRGYEPGNVRWATPKEQANNRKNTVYVDLLGVRTTLQQAASYFQVTDCAIRKRIRKHGGLDGYYPRGTSKGENKRLPNTKPNMALLPCA
jgi:hypothetical protein